MIELLQEAADEIDALQARAQVQGEHIGYRHPKAPNKIISVADLTEQPDWVKTIWQKGEKLYTTPQTAQATQAWVTDELCWRIWDKAGACDEVNERVTLKVAKPIIRAIVAAYLEVAAPRGITAQAKKEGNHG